MGKKLFQIGEWLPLDLPMIYDDMNIYYNYTMKKFAESDFSQINSVYTSQ